MKTTNNEESVPHMVSWFNGDEVLRYIVTMTASQARYMKDRLMQLGFDDTLIYKIHKRTISHVDFPCCGHELGCERTISHVEMLEVLTNTQSVGDALRRRAKGWTPCACQAQESDGRTHSCE